MAASPLSPQRQGRRSRCFSFVSALSPFKSSRRVPSSASVNSKGRTWGDLSVHKPENLEQRFLRDEEDDTAGANTHRPAMLPDKTDPPNYGVLGGETVCLPDVPPRRGREEKISFKAEAAQATMVTLEFARGEMVEFDTKSGLMMRNNERHAAEGVEGINCVVTLASKRDKEDRMQSGKVVRVRGREQHSSVPARNTDVDAGRGVQVKGLQSTTPNVRHHKFRGSGWGEEEASKASAGPLPPPIASSSAAFLVRSSQDTRPAHDEEDGQMCPFCREVHEVKAGEEDDGVCKYCGENLQVDDMAFMHIARQEQSLDSAEKPPTWALPEDAPVNIHKVFFSPDLFPADSIIPPEPQIPAHRPYRKKKQGPNEEQGPGRGNIGSGRGEESLVGWMSIPVDKWGGARLDGLNGEKYQHKKVTKESFVSTSKMVYKDASHPDAPVWIDDDIDDERKLEARTSRGQEEEGALGNSYPRLKESLSHLRGAYHDKRLTGLFTGGVWEGITSGLGMLGLGGELRGRQRAPVKAAKAGASSNWSSVGGVGGVAVDM